MEHTADYEHAERGGGIRTTAPGRAAIRPRRQGGELVDRRVGGAGRARSGWLLALLLAVAGCAEEPEAPAKAPVRPAKLMVVTASENVRSVRLPAVIEAADSVGLAFQAAGQVTAIIVREGQPVAKGAEIARLDQRDLRTELATARANHDAAVTEFRRAQRLIGQGAISQSVYDQRKTRRDVTAATLKTARKRLDDSVLRSPFAGVVAAVHAKQFQNVAPQQAVVTLQTTGDAEAVVQAPATLVAHSGRIEPRETVVVLDAAPGRPIPAKYHSIAPRTDPAEQTFEVRFVFTPPAGLVILPGMTGAVRSKVVVVAGKARAQITVPIEAVLSEAGAQYVWVVDAGSMTVTRRNVTLGDGVGETLPVLEGLGAGETIVAAGVSYLHEGMRVRRYER